MTKEVGQAGEAAPGVQSTHGARGHVGPDWCNVVVRNDSAPVLRSAKGREASAYVGLTPQTVQQWWQGQHIVGLSKYGSAIANCVPS